MQELRRRKPILGTYVEIGLPQTEPSLQASEAAFSAIEQVHNLMSFFSPTSDISRLNLTPDTWVPISHHTYKVLRLSKALYLASQGLFNIAIGGKLVEKGVLPNLGFPLLSAIGNPLGIDLMKNQAKNGSQGLICLDGIAKGYAVDQGIKALRRFGLSYAWINAGGDIRVFGDRTIPIEQKKANAEVVSIGGLRDKAIATSEVFNAPNSDFRSWIVNNNELVEPGIFSIISNHAWRADALTKVAALSPKKGRAEIIANLGGYLVEV